jgi:hypothetical protein
MTDIDAFDTTSADYERFEAELLARDRDRTHASTADVDEWTARQLVSDLIDDGDVIPVPEEKLLVHEPSGEAFESITQLAVFHRGWTAGRDAGQEES